MAEQSTPGTFSKGLLKENPVLRQLLGMCPTLAVTTAVSNGIGMGIATTFVLVCSGVVVSLLRKIIPNSVRIPAFITVIASFVTLVMMLVKAYVPALDKALGIYLPLIVVNCIVLGRAEAFASKNSVGKAALDGLGMGAGFTIALICMSAIRELLGAGTLLGFQIMPSFVEPMLIMVTPAGGFAVLGVLIALSVWFEQSRQRKAGEPVTYADNACAGCPLDCGIGDPEDEKCERTNEMLEKAEAALLEAGNDPLPLVVTTDKPEAEPVPAKAPEPPAQPEGKERDA